MKQCSALRVALCEFLGNFCGIVRLNITGNHALGVLIHAEYRLRASAASHINAVVNENTRCVRLIIQVGIHGADNVVAQHLFIVPGNLGNTGCLLIVDIRDILIDSVIAGNDGNIRIRRIQFNNMKDLSACAGCVIENHFGLSRRTGNENVIFFRNYIVVAVCSKCRFVVYDIRVRPVCDGGKRSRRSSTYEHNGSYQNSRNA